jgi:hypothetical protein
VRSPGSAAAGAAQQNLFTSRDPTLDAEVNNNKNDEANFKSYCYLLGLNGFSDKDNNDAATALGGVKGMMTIKDHFFDEVDAYQAAHNGPGYKYDFFAFYFRWRNRPSLGPFHPKQYLRASVRDSALEVHINDELK